MVALLPRTFQEVPPGLRVELSLDGRSFTTAVEVPTYYGPLYWSGGHPMGRVRWGRVELRFSPARARFVRVAQLGASSRFAWSVRELFVYEAVRPRRRLRRPRPPRRWRPSSGPGAHRVLGDHAVAARLAQASRDSLVTPSANLHALDGTMPPPGLLPSVSPGPDLAIAYAPELPSATSIEAVLARAGWSFSREDIGSYRLLTRFARRPLGGRASRGRAGG